MAVIQHRAMSSLALATLQRIQTRQARIGIIGLGYVGLPLAVEFARAGFDVTGFDVDERKNAAINAGDSYIPDVAAADLAEVVRAERFRGTADMARLQDMDVIDICVPTPLRKTKDPDLSYVVKAVEACAAALRPGQLVILESTTYPGTTDEVVQPMLEEKGSPPGPTSSWRSRPSGSIPGTTRTPPRTSRKSSVVSAPRARKRQRRSIRTPSIPWSRSARRGSPKW